MDKEKEIKALYCETTKQNQFEFGLYDEAENKITTSLYHTYNWDIINIKYNVK